MSMPMKTPRGGSLLQLASSSCVLVPIENVNAPKMLDIRLHHQRPKGKEFWETELGDSVCQVTPCQRMQAQDVQVLVGATASKSTSSSFHPGLQSLTSLMLKELPLAVL